MDTGLLPIGTIDVLKFAQKNNPQMRQKWSLVTACAEFATSRASINPSKKLQVYTYTLIIAVLRLQLTVDRNEEC